METIFVKFRDVEGWLLSWVGATTYRLKRISNCFNKGSNVLCKSIYLWFWGLSSVMVIQRKMFGLSVYGGPRFNSRARLDYFVHTGGSEDW